MKNILIISDGIPGHFNQSRGVASLLSNRHSSNIQITDITFMQKDRKKLIKSKNDLEEIINYGKDTSEHITIADELFVNYEANTNTRNYY